MAIDIPARDDLISQALAELQTAIDAVDADQTTPQPPDIDLDRAMTRAVAIVLGGALSGIYQRQQALSAQAAPINARDEVLVGWAGSLNLQRRAASAASGVVAVSGMANGVVPAGVIYQRADNGIQYKVTDDIDLDADGNGSGQVTATTLGAETNAPAATALSIVNPTTGIDASAIVGADALGGGADVERDDALLERVLSKLGQAPAGGNAKDYRDWALEVPGVTEAWPFPLHRGNGTVDLAVQDADGTGDAIATQATVDAVQAHIDPLKPCEMPAGAFEAFAPTRQPLDFEIHVTPDSTAVRNAVAAELADLITREATPEGTLLLSHIRAAVSAAAGETDNNVIAPAANVTAGDRAILTMGAITWS